MITRRDTLVGTGCLAAALASYVLKPTRALTLLGDGKLDAIVPRSFGKWTSTDISDQFAPQTEDSLSAKLYGETIGRLYQSSATDTQITMLMAHGGSETNELQLHRPEVCYPAFGFAIQSNQAINVSLAPQIDLPSRALIAQSTDTKLATIYWTRLGEYLPTTGSEQRLDRMKTAIEGYIPDGLLARFSSPTTEPDHTVSTISKFIAQLVLAVRPNLRAPLIGSARSVALRPY